MGKLNFGKNKRKLIALVVVLVILGLGIIGGLKLFGSKENPAPPSGEGDTRGRTDYSPQEIVDLAPTPEFAYTTLFTNAEAAKRLGQMGKAEAYLVEAVNQAKIINDQTTIDNAYGILIRFYQSQNNQAKLDEVKSTLGEEKYGALTAPPPAEEVPFK